LPSALHAAWWHAFAGMQRGPWASIPALVISAIVVNWNGADYLPACLDALLQQEPCPDEVLVVDNASTDGSQDMVRERYPHVRWIDTGANRGPCHARNVGIAAAKHELCLLVDNDVVMAAGTLRTMLDAIDQDGQCAMVQARSLCGDDPGRVHYDGAELHFLGILALHNWYRPLAEARFPAQPMGAAIALCFLTRRAVYQRVGGFDERLFILYEDNEFSYKLRMHGYHIRLAEGFCRHLAGTKGLSRRGAEADYTARRVQLHSRNRWYVLLTCMRWRTLLLTMPAQLVYGIVYCMFGMLEGGALSWCRGKWELLRMLPAALRQRRIVQRGRTVPDRDILVSLPLTLNPGLAEGGLRAFVRRSLDRFFAGYWCVVRRLCG
jgi:GT2 family glycosyltransferase